MSIKIVKSTLLLFAGAALFMPLIVMSNSFIFPFIVPKILFFRSMVVGMVACYILLLCSDWNNYKPRLTWQTGVVGLFFLSFAVSTFTGVDSYRSMWDNHERMLGLFTLLHYGAFFLVLSSPAVDKKGWVWLSRVFLVLASLVMVTAILQRLFIDGSVLTTFFQEHPNRLIKKFMQWNIISLNSGAERVIATLGNAIYVSGYGLFLWLFGAYWYFQEKISSKWRQFGVVASVLGFFGIFLGGTRGTLLAVLAVCGVLCIALMVQKHSKRLRQIGAGAVGSVCLLICLLVGFRTSTFVESIPGINRLVSTSLADALSSPRFMAWEVAVESWKDYPVFGWGPNNFYYGFNTYYRPEFLRSGYGETWFDNAHNIVVNTLATQGVFGLAVYLSLFILFGSVLFTRFTRSQTKDEAIQWALLLAFLVGHFVHNVFVFENPTSYLYFFFLLAFIVRLLLSSDETASLKNYNKSVSSGLAISVVLVSFLFMFATNINPARANMASLDLLRQVAQKGSNPVALFDVAINYPTPHIDDLRNDFGRTALSYAQSMGGIDKQKAITVLDRAIVEGVKNSEIHPLDVRVYMLLSDLYSKRESLVRDGSSLPHSFIALERAHQLSPKRQQVLFIMASLYQIMGDNTHAIQLYTEARDLDNTIAEGWGRLVYAYAIAGDVDMVKSTVKEAEAEHINLDGYSELIKEVIQKDSK